MKKMTLLVAALAMALMVAIPAFAQTTATNTVETNQTGTATATSGDANAATDQYSSQTQTAPNEATDEQDVTADQVAAAVDLQLLNDILVELGLPIVE